MKADGEIDLWEERQSCAAGGEGSDKTDTTRERGLLLVL